jgi:hypothetical protein
MSRMRPIAGHRRGLTCGGMDFITLAADQHYTARLQGSACDLGAIEGDFLFFNVFE